jgi:hypothetical protein
LVAVVDTNAPVLAGVPADVTVTQLTMPAPGAPTATDDSDPNPQVTFAEDTEPGAADGTSIVTRTWTATDACGNTSSATQTITVMPVIPPYLRCCPQNGQIQFNWDAQEGVTYQLQATDTLIGGTWVNVGNAVTAESEQASCGDSMGAGCVPRFYRLQVVP